MILPFDVPPAIEEKCTALARVLTPYPCIAVAYSGGVDSSFLAWFAGKALQKEVVALLVNSPFVSRREHEAAHSVADAIGLRVEEVKLDPLALQAVQENSRQRCYACKRAIMGEVKRRAEDLHCSVVVDGSHAGDVGGYRPGRKALEELGILSPLALAGLVKSEIRELSRLAKLPTWNKPSQSCLATRVGYGTPLTEETLSRIEQAEALLLDLGCRLVRVRVHGNLARIEADPGDFPVLTDETHRKTIVRRLTELGFAHVSLDLAGFRSGSWDDVP